MGSAESKLSLAENSSNKILEEADSVSVCNLSKKCTADVYSVGAEVGLARKLGNGNNEESSACDGIVENIKISKDLEFRGNDGIRNENVEEPIENDEHILYPHEPSSPTKIEVSGNGINLFVEVFGPLDGISEGKNKSMIAKNDSIDIVDGKEFTYDVGDLVWVKTRTPLWWPATISDPNNAAIANDAMKPEKKGSFLVKYFGNANFIWCENSDLKPFHEYFEQFSGQNSSRSFFGAVEKASSVLGQHVKSKMTCPCFKKEENSISMDKRGEFDVLSLSRFEPVTFCALIRNLASGFYIPNKLELIIIKNRLSAFYSSVGHLELPLQMLRSATDKDEVIDEACKKFANSHNDDVMISKRKRKKNKKYDADHILGDEMASSGKGSESRERKKSKYLSYPYVDVKEPNVGQETEDSKSNSRKRGSKKPSCQKTDNIDASSDELLAELCCTARDSVYLGTSKYSDSLMRFYTSFRIFAFLDADVASKTLLEQNSSEVEGVKIVKESQNKPLEVSVENAVADKIAKMNNPQEKGKKRAKKKKEKVLSACTGSSISNSLNMGPSKESVGSDVADSSSKTDNPQEKGDVASKEKLLLSAVMEPISNSFNMGTNNDLNNAAWMINFQQNCSDAPQRKNTPENIDSVAKMPDLNGNQPCFSIAHNPSTNPNVDQTVQNIPQLNNGINQEFATSQLEMNLMKNGLFQKPYQMGPFPYTGQPEKRKRKRKEKTSQIPPAIPDLNGNLPDKTLPEGNSTQSPDENPQKRKKSNKYATADGETNPGGSLLLTFSAGSALPTKETLVSTFSRFGLLRESEMQVLSDSSLQIVYERSSEARFAYRSLEKSNPFGESLVSFKLHCMPDAASRFVERKNKVQMMRPVAPVDASKNLPAQHLPPQHNLPGQHGETRDIGFIRQNVEFMKITLEKAGDNLSVEMRAKLESEIKGLLDKISSMAGGSASA